MNIYIDNDFRCFTDPSEERQEKECEFFDGRSKKYIEGYRFIPEGEVWTREDGVEFTGEMISPIEDPELLERLDELEKLHESVVANSEYILGLELEKALQELN